MKPNVGGLDRNLRIAAGLVLILLALLAGMAGIWKWLVLALGVAMVVTALVRFCPAYTLFGIDSCRRK